VGLGDWLHTCEWLPNAALKQASAIINRPNHPAGWLVAFKWTQYRLFQGYNLSYMLIFLKTSATS